MYLLERNPQTVTLTFKDIHDYCAANRNVEYVNPEFIAIDFPWLTDSMQSLKIYLINIEIRLGMIMQSTYIICQEKYLLT